MLYEKRASYRVYTSAAEFSSQLLFLLWRISTPWTPSRKKRLLSYCFILWHVCGMLGKLLPNIFYCYTGSRQACQGIFIAILILLIGSNIFSDGAREISMMVVRNVQFIVEDGGVIKTSSLVFLPFAELHLMSPRLGLIMKYWAINHQYRLWRNILVFSIAENQTCAH